MLAVACSSTLAGLIQQNRQALKSTHGGLRRQLRDHRAARDRNRGRAQLPGSTRYPHKIDLTKNKIHTLSDQTVKLVKGLKQPVKATLFAKISQREQLRPLLDNYKALNPKFEVEFVDPDKEPTRAKEPGIKKYGTLHLTFGTHERQDRGRHARRSSPTRSSSCSRTRPTRFARSPATARRASRLPMPTATSETKKALADQQYEVKDINLIQDQKTLPSCDAIAVIGPTKSFFDQEVKILTDYLADGGRAIFALDMNLKGAEYAPELEPLLKSWYVAANDALVVDPFSQMMGGDAAVPLITTFSKSSPITKDFHSQCFFPFTRPLETLPGAPAGTHAEWIGQTNPNAWGIVDLKALEHGSVHSKQPNDKGGPLNVAVAVEGKTKDSKASRNTRLVVFGTSFFADNKFSRFGGNQDLLLNSAAWVLEDESSISIHTKEEGPGKVELTQKAGTFIFLLTVILIPALIGIGGIVIWAVRRRW